MVKEIKWVGIPKNIEDYQGFVYSIVHVPTGKFYIGKKNYWFKKTAKPLKGKKNKRHSLVESDWKDYWGSSKEFSSFIKGKNKKDFHRIILHNCRTKWDMSYVELLEQLRNDVLYNKDSFNGIINVRLRRRK